MKEEPLTWVSFRDVTWLQHFALNEETVFTYLSLSQFYDRSCNNEILRMQTKFTTDSKTQMNDALLAMTGIEYALISSQAPDFFLLHKRQRTSPTQTFLLNVVVILKGTIYMAPSLYALLSYRISSLADNLDRAWRYGSEWVEPNIFTGNYQLKQTRPDEKQATIHPQDAAAVQEMTNINISFLSLIQKINST